MDSSKNELQAPNLDLLFDEVGKGLAYYNDELLYFHDKDDEISTESRLKLELFRSLLQTLSTVRWYEQRQRELNTGILGELP